jgi:hypothetical protein
VKSCDRLPEHALEPVDELETAPSWFAGARKGGLPKPNIRGSEMGVRAPLPQLYGSVGRIASVQPPEPADARHEPRKELGS